MRLPNASRSRAIFIGSAHYQDELLHDLLGAEGNVNDLFAHLTNASWGPFSTRFLRCDS